MLRRAREVGPALLVPLAWLFVTAAHLDHVTDHTLFIALVVMAVLLAVFAVTGRFDMRAGTLRVWWAIVVGGFVLTLLGVVGFAADAVSEPLWALSLFGWMLLPAIGFVDTGRRVVDGSWLYLGGATGCILGAMLYGSGLYVSSVTVQIVGLVVVGLGQTAGILHAVLRY
jgi:hypothetical protein